MARNSQDIEKMLDELGMTHMSCHLNELMRSPESVGLTPLQMLREVVSPQYLQYKNEQFKDNLRFSKLILQDAEIENLRTGPERIYNENLISQLKTLEFIDDRKNMTVVGY